MLITIIAKKVKKNNQIDNVLRKLFMAECREAALIREVDKMCYKYNLECIRNGMKPIDPDKADIASVVRYAAEWAWDEGESTPEEVIDLVDAYLYLRPWAIGRREFKKCSIQEYCTKASYPRLLGLVLADWARLAK